MRCFVACWPDEATRARLDQAARDAHQRHPDARRMRAGNLHLTLAFIGELSSSQAPAVVEALERLAVERFDWRVDHIGRFEGARVLWAGGPPEPRLIELAEHVRAELTGLRVRFDQKRFAAHVTLLRDLPASRRGATENAAQAIEPFAWPIGEALLVASERDPAGATLYRPLQAH
jgi:2'-5' RNA ligase